MDGFILSRPDHGVLTRGTRRRFADAAQAQRALRDGSVALLVGAIPFDPQGACALYEPEWSSISDRRWQPGETEVLPPTWVAAEIPAPSEHVQRVKHLVERLRAGQVDKVVAARAVKFSAEHPIGPPALAARMSALNPDATVFAVDLSAAGTEFAGHSLVGASPELLVSRRGDVVTCHPLAGTAPRSTDPTVDQAAGAALLGSSKNLAEHGYVTAWIRDVLGPLCSELSVPTIPELTGTPEVWHLATAIRGTLRDPSTSALDLAVALHPTPALCGTPTPKALEIIRESEEPRRFYGGAVGWCDQRGDGDWVVAIRCAEISADGRTAWAWAGGGIVAESDPQDELDETSAKFRTLLTALRAMTLG